MKIDLSNYRYTFGRAYSAITSLLLILSSLVLLTLLLPMSVFAVAPNNSASSSSLDVATPSSVNEPSGLSMLNDMRESVLRTDYQLYFLLQSANQYSSTFRYEHVGSKTGNNASLVYLEGSAKEIILHDNIVSYFQSDSVPFSISASHIIEAFPRVIYSDFNSIVNAYDFILLGKSRTANRSSQLVRIVPKDKDRYSYVVWIDDKSNLPLRIDLLDLDANVIQQMKVIELNLDFNKKTFDDYIKNRDYPIIFPIEKENSELNNWQVTWLPKSFKEIAAYNINFYRTDIDTRLFSDGIFSFTVNVSERSSDSVSHILEQGARTIYSTNLDNMNVVIIGNLPVETMEKIALSIKLK